MEEVEETTPNSVPHDVTVRFVVPYETKWGEYVLLSGNRGLLGAGSTCNGLKMSCRMGERGLEWETSVVVPDQYECEYHYTVYNEHSDRVIMKECTKHVLKVPASVAGSTIILSDSFQVCCPQTSFMCLVRAPQATCASRGEPYAGTEQRRKHLQVNSVQRCDLWWKPDGQASEPACRARPRHDYRAV